MPDVTHFRRCGIHHCLKEKLTISLKEKTVNVCLKPNTQKISMGCNDFLYRSNTEDITSEICSIVVNHD